MRKVKFRAWDIEDLTMVYQNNEEYLIGYDGVDLYLAKEGYFGGDLEWSTVEKAEFMQYTGLNDKNSKEIYEGDIVNWDKWDGHNLEKEKLKIIWIREEAGFYGIGINDKTRIISLINSRVGLEVIGNIYENPELI